MIHFLKRNELQQKIQDQQGRFFTIAFRKMDGSPRKMNGRCGVTKHSNGGKAYKSPHLVNLYDVHNKGYRFANTDTAMILNAEKKTFVIVD